MRFYHESELKPEVVDLSLKGLPENCEVNQLKAVSGSKHVISAVVDEDNMKGTCTGTGRIKLRLNHGESVDQVMMNFAQMGIQVKKFEQNLNK